jgi:hypothetical protein
MQRFERELLHGDHHRLSNPEDIQSFHMLSAASIPLPHGPPFAAVCQSAGAVWAAGACCRPRQPCPRPPGSPSARMRRQRRWTWSTTTATHRFQPSHSVTANGALAGSAAALLLLTGTSNRPLRNVRSLWSIVEGRVRRQVHRLRRVQPGVDPGEGARASRAPVNQKEEGDG